MDEEARLLLREIRDLQQQHLDEYRQASARAIALQQTAVDRQKRIATFYTRVVVASVILVGLLLALLVWLIRLL